MKDHHKDKRHGHGSGHAGMKMPMGNAHWEKHPGDTEVANGKYASEFGASSELKGQVDGLANYVKKHKMKY